MYAVLAIVLAGLLWLAYRHDEKTPVGPSTLFVGGFFISTLVALAYSGAWGVALSLPTFFVVHQGNLIFLLAAFGTHALVTRFAPAHTPASRPASRFTRLLDDSPGRANYAVVALVQLIVFGVTLVYIQQRFPGLSLAEAIRSYNAADTFTTEDVGFPVPFRQIRGLVVSGGYVVAYFAGRELALGLSKRAILPLVCVGLAMALILEMGTRTEAVVIAICVAVAFFLERRKVTVGPLLDKRVVLGVLIACGAGLLLFKFMAIGRDVGSYATADYLAEYLGAEIPNLDTFLSRADIPVERDLAGYMTFVANYGYLGEKLGIHSWVYTLDLPFLTSNGYDMGNVYTTFYAFLYDFGYMGLILLTALMAVVSQLVYEFACRPRGLGLACGVLYGKVASTLLLSFFSNKFYEAFYLGFIVAAACMVLFYFLFLFPSRPHMDVLAAAVRPQMSKLMKRG